MMRLAPEHPTESLQEVFERKKRKADTGFGPVKVRSCLLGNKNVSGFHVQMAQRTWNVQLTYSLEYAASVQGYLLKMICDGIADALTRSAEELCCSGSELCSASLGHEGAKRA